MNAKLKVIIESYCERLPDAVEGLAQAHESADVEQVRHAAHRLRGTARTLGIDSLEAALAIVENSASPGHVGTIAPAFVSDQIAMLRALATAVRPSDSRLWALATGD